MPGEFYLKFWASFPFLFFLAVSALAQTDLEILKNPSMLSSFYERDIECSPGQNIKKIRCPEAFQYIVDEVAKTSFYSFLASQGQKKIIESCQLEEKEILPNYEVLGPLLKKTFDSALDIPNELMSKCFEGVRAHKDSPSTQEIQKEGIAAYLHGLDRKMEDLKMSRLKELASLDRLLGRQALTDIHCDEGEEKNFCDKLMACPKESGQLEEVTDFSLASLEEMIALETQLEELRKYRVSLQGEKKIKEHQQMVREIKDNIEYITSMNPWFQGQGLKESLEKIKLMIKQKKRGGAQLIFREKLAKQWEEGRELVKKDFTKLNVSQSCVRDNLFCSRDILHGLNEYYTHDDQTGPLEGLDPRAVAIEKIKVMGSCIAKKKSHKDVIDDRMALGAGMGVGLVVGGAGGVLRLGSMALNFYQKGMRLRGLASAALLGLEGKMVNNSFSSVAKNCEKSLNMLGPQKSNSAEGDLCSLDGRGFYKVSDLKSCIADIALTTGAYALSLKEKTVGKTALRAQASVETAENILKDLPLSLHSKLGGRELKNYSSFLETLSAKEQKIALKDLEELVASGGKASPGKYVEMFLAKEKKFDYYTRLQEERIRKELLKKGESEADALQKSKVLALEKRDKLHERFYSCQAPSGNKAQMLTGQRYVGVSMALGGSAAVAGHYNRYSERFENNKLEWFSKLGYDIALMYLGTKVNEKLVKSNASGTVTGKYFQTLGDSLKIGSIDAALYSQFYGVSEEEAAIRMEEIRNSPEAMRELKILEAYADKENLAEEFAKKIVESYKKILGAKDREILIGPPPYQIGGETFSELKVEDLERPQVKEKLVKAVLRQMNSGQGDPLISSGSLGVDRALGDLPWNAALSIPKNMVLGVAIYQILCLGQDYPFASMGAVAAIQTINQFVTKDSYYAYRKAMIGQ